MPIINLDKVHDLYASEIREQFNVHEKIELSRILINVVEHEYNKAMKVREWQND